VLPHGISGVTATFVPVFVSTTSVCGIAAAVWSVTVPLTLLVLACGHAQGTISANESIKTKPLPITHSFPRHIPPAGTAMPRHHVGTPRSTVASSLRTVGPA
jgi:hypothetical protein